MAVQFWTRRQPSTEASVEGYQSGSTRTRTAKQSWAAHYPVAMTLMADVGKLKEKMMAEAGSWAAVDYAELDRRVEIMKQKALAAIEHPGIDSHDPPKLDVVELTAAIDSAATDKDLPF